jgi:hypothetical protein
VAKLALELETMRHENGQLKSKLIAAETALKQAPKPSEATAQTTTEATPAAAPITEAAEDKGQEPAEPGTIHLALFCF